MALALPLTCSPLFPRQIRDMETGRAFKLNRMVQSGDTVTIEIPIQAPATPGPFGRTFQLFQAPTASTPLGPTLWVKLEAVEEP